MAATLTGLIFLQYILLRDAVVLKQQAFRENVNAALTTITRKLQTREAVNNVFRYATSGDKGKNITVHITTRRGAGKKSTITAFDSTNAGLAVIASPIRFEGNFLHYTVTSPQHVMLRVFNSVGEVDTVLVDAFQMPGEYAVPMDRRRFQQGEYFCKFGTDRSAMVMRISYDDEETLIPGMVSIDQRRALVGQVIDNLVVNEDQPIERRIDPAILDTVIRTSLRESGITLGCAYGVGSGRADSLRIVAPASEARHVLNAEFRTPLFPFDFLSSRSELLLYFPNQQLYLLKSIGPMLGLSILFMSAIILCFALTLRMIVRQQQFSERLSGFINNMTHEFKTPVSTIAVAAETMMRSEILEQPQKLLRYGTVIHDESQRMKQHIDRILQMAVLEEGEYELKLEPVSVHDTLSKTVTSVHMRIEGRQGEIRSEYRAAGDVVFADPVHLANIFHNLLDNAFKYSPGKPVISVETWNEGRTIAVRIGDRGIGIAREDLKRVFEKYYRVPTGNIHTVKGFGLGLSYVKLMADAHGAHIDIQSEPGKGTSITLNFPLMTDQHNEGGTA